MDVAVLLPLSYGIYYFVVEDNRMFVMVAIWLLTFLYKPIMESVFGWTVGKAVMRLRVVDGGNNLNIDLNQSFIRFLPWAVSYFVSLFVYVRVSQTAGVTELDGFMDWNAYLARFPLNENLLISMGNNFPVFSAVWLITDPWNRALHDRWARTFVIRQVLPVPKE